MYLCKVHPYEDALTNRMEIVNESLAIYMLFFFQCLMNPAVPIPARWYISWGMLSTCAVLVTYNTVLIAKELIKECISSIKEAYKKCIAKCKAKADKMCPSFSASVSKCCT